MDLPDLHQAWPTNNFEAKSICIIGAGPAGLAALKAILETPQSKSGLWTATIFESRENVGGVWLPAKPTDNPPLTPLYDSLTANLPHPVMAFSSFSFKPSTPLFPCAAVVQTYLEAYAEKFQMLTHIRLNTSVLDIKRESLSWKVHISTGQILDFDFVIVANGHFRIPRYPEAPGLPKWLAAGRARHSAWYRAPEYLGKTVLVVGSGPSGLDISAEMCTTATTVIQSCSRTATVAQGLGNIRLKGRVKEFRDDGEVIFEDETSELGVDYCILATGYQLSMPFFSDLILKHEVPSLAPPLPRELYNSSYNIFPLAQHIFPLHGEFPPSCLAFMGLLSHVAPFPLLEAQAQAIVKVFAQPDYLDPTKEAVDIITRHEMLKLKFGDSPLWIAKRWHEFEADEQFDYRDQLYRLAGPGHIIRVADWEKEMYENKIVLRNVWRQLEIDGEADEWVKGVGEGGLQEWVELMRRMLLRAKHPSDVQEQGKTRL